MPNHPLGEDLFPNIQPKPLLTQVHAIFSGQQREEISVCPSASPSEEAVDSNEVAQDLVHMMFIFFCDPSFS